MNTKNGMVSVIIPVYNREKYIEECIASVQEQSYQNFEIVLVDDGSTDNTLSICKKLAENDARIRIFEGEHKGVSAARNTALDNAKGEYVFFLDSDDAIHTLLFETLVKGMEESGASISGTCCMSVGLRKWQKLDEIKQKISLPAKLEFLDNLQVVEAFFGGGTALNLIGGCMMKRDYVADTRFNTDIYIGEDFLFIYENLIKGGKAALLNQKWYYARIHKENSSWDWSFEGYLTRFKRRFLVAESEAKLGRTKISNNQKREAFFIFVNCQGKNKLNSSDAKKMRKHIKQYGKEIFPLFTLKGKIKYILAVYLPYFYYFILKVYERISKKR